MPLLELHNLLKISHYAAFARHDRLTVAFKLSPIVSRPRLAPY